MQIPTCYRGALTITTTNEELPDGSTLNLTCLNAINRYLTPSTCAYHTSAQVHESSSFSIGSLQHILFLLYSLI